jgi:hypothetical protein
VGRVRVGVAFYDEVFLLQHHIATVRQQLARLEAGAAVH